MKAENNFTKLLLSRKSIRRYKKKDVPDSIVKEILRSGQRAPTACKMEPYSFILISDKNKRKQIMNATVTHKGTLRYMDESPVWIMICVDFARQKALNNYLEIESEFGEMSKFILGIIDASLAAENMVIAAESFGLGSCFVGSIWTKPLEVGKILETPEFVYPLMLLCIGYPDEEPRLSNRWPYEKIVHKDIYSKISNKQLSSFSKTRKKRKIGAPYKMDDETNKRIKEEIKKIGFKI